MCISPFAAKHLKAFCKISFTEGKYCIEAANKIISNFIPSNNSGLKLSHTNSRLSFLKTRWAWRISLWLISRPITYGVFLLRIALTTATRYRSQLLKYLTVYLFSTGNLPAFAMNASWFAIPYNGCARGRYPAKTSTDNRNIPFFPACAHQCINPQIPNLTPACGLVPYYDKLCSRPC